MIVAREQFLKDAKKPQPEQRKLEAGKPITNRGEEP
jgi:hypothetical protein